jgi:hypothetical protein
MDCLQGLEIRLESCPVADICFIHGLTGDGETREPHRVQRLDDQNFSYHLSQECAHLDIGLRRRNCLLAPIRDSEDAHS